jgi:hypothetical protein
MWRSALGLLSACVSRRVHKGSCIKLLLHAVRPSVPLLIESPLIMLSFAANMLVFSR